MKQRYLIALRDVMTTVAFICWLGMAVISIDAAAAHQYAGITPIAHLAYATMAWLLFFPSRYVMLWADRQVQQ